MARIVAAEHLQVEALRPAYAGQPLTLGSILIARTSPRSTGGPPARPPGAAGGEFLAMYIATFDGAARAYVADARGPPMDFAGRECILLVAPLRVFAELPSGAPSRLPPSLALNVLQRYLDGLLVLDSDRLSDRQADLAVAAVQTLISAGLAPGGGERGLGSRRRASLTDRIGEHVDAHLQTPLSVDSVCAALGCSRSALYRATAAAGGVAELIAARRLLAVRDLLRDPQERRSIAELATTYGFSDAVQFNRRFKLAFGVTPGVVRRAAAQAGSARAPLRLRSPA